MRFDTIREAAHQWVATFNAIPQSVVSKLMTVSNYNDIQEVTPITQGDRVIILDVEHNGKSGEVIHSSGEDHDTLLVRLDGSDECVSIDTMDAEVQRDDGLPMWGTMWAFGESLDNWWLEERGGMEAMAECGFRIYRSEDYVYIFGIDGAGYDFYEDHWIPLYKARGLQWHKAA